MPSPNGWQPGAVAFKCVSDCGCELPLDPPVQQGETLNGPFDPRTSAGFEFNLRCPGCGVYWFRSSVPSETFEVQFRP